MAIDRDRTSHGKVGVRLHDLYREIMRVYGTLQIPPHNTGLYRDLFIHRVEVQYSIELPHVDVNAVLISDLTSHAESSATNGDRTPCTIDYLNDFPGGPRLDLATYVDGIYRRDIVHAFVRYDFIKSGIARYLYDQDYEQDVSYK